LDQTALLSIVVACTLLCMRMNVISVHLLVVGAQELFLADKSNKVRVPNYHACQVDEAKQFPYCNSSLDIELRLDDLMSRLSLEERIATISPQPALGINTCATHTAGKPEIGLPSYMWLVESNTAVYSNCLERERCATTFVGPLGLGASFNRSNWRLKGDVLATELRAFNNIGWHTPHHGQDDGIGITGFGPNINILRDPRFGRASELPGEDPYLNGHYAKEMVSGMQTKDAKGHPKMLAYLKHFTAYSRETDRGHDSYDISLHDLHESYLAAYKIAFMEGEATGAMCSYNAVNGVPACADNYTLNEVLRKAWGRPDAHITTDCGAVSNMRGPPADAPTDEAACAWTINNGTDLEMGSTEWTSHMRSAVAQGLVDPSTIDTAARRAFRVLFRGGRFDPLEDVEWAHISSSVINSTQHQQIARDAALQSFVLLKNDNVLPLAKGKTLAVVGPMGVNRNLFSDYAGWNPNEQCFNASYDCVPTIAEAIEATNLGGKTTYATGVDVNSDDTSGIQDAMELVMAADVVILVLGNDKSQEHESIDRPDTALPGQQELFGARVLAAGKPTILVLSNGGALAIDHLLGYDSNCTSEGCGSLAIEFPPPGAVVEAFNPAFEAMALASSLFGDENRWGKLPMTMYPHSFAAENPMTNYDMSKSPGRTYKYYTGKPLFGFGHGLSYTDFEMSCVPTTGASLAIPGNVTCSVTNVGARRGDEVVMMFHSAQEDVRSQAKHPVPLRSLVNFDRISLDSKETVETTFSVDLDTIRLIDENGALRKYNGTHQIILTRGHGEDVVFDVFVK